MGFQFLGLLEREVRWREGSRWGVVGRRAEVGTKLAWRENRDCGTGSAWKKLARFLHILRAPRLARFLHGRIRANIVHAAIMPTCLVQFLHIEHVGMKHACESAR